LVDDDKPEPIPFPIEVTVNGIKVTVTLMLGTREPQKPRRGSLKSLYQSRSRNPDLNHHVASTAVMPGTP
jgi:hypothetical protein